MFRLLALTMTIVLCVLSVIVVYYNKTSCLLDLYVIQFSEIPLGVILFASMIFGMLIAAFFIISIVFSMRRKHKIMTKLEDQVKEFVKEFIEFHNRNPMRSEIIENMQDKMSPEILDKLIKKIQDDGIEIINIGDENA